MTWKRGEMCESCAGRKGTEANRDPATAGALAGCIDSGEPFYCHESTAVPDPEGLSSDRHGNRYRALPFSRWRLCRAWMNAAPEGGRSATVSAPWTDEEVENLNRWQAAGYVHELTCPNEHEGSRVLIADSAGWYCGGCEYTQTWAHNFMLQGPPANPLEWLT